ncbi:uncharacterized protein LOC577184 isoform X4 [Strongylocentrotus purpuratus]|uniref:Uncharacterized protein n=1 Tax=Strongylocentrotus purpuratus TaxID=7668 RepID=A0A7M7N2S8_STRPU|nr:uncharacterized protein LOC577184 isoform X4 [Strongylocentrotus purpuratus]
MGIYGISKLSILSGILFLILQIGAADKPSPSSDTARSSTTTLLQEARQGISAIHTATHLSSQKTQSSLKGAEQVSLNVDALHAIDNDRLRQLQDEISDINHRKSSSVSTAAAPEDLLTEIPIYITKATSDSKEYVTETDVRAKFGTTASDETLTKVDTNLQTTTSSETLTEVDSNYLLSATTSAAEILTESPSISSSGWTTKQAEILTVSPATHQPDGEVLATKAASKSRTTVAVHSELITEGVEETEASTVVPAASAASDHVTIADTTDSGVLQGDLSIDRTSRTKESVIGGDNAEFPTRDEAVIDSTSTPSQHAFVLPAGYVSPPEENDADVVDDDDNAIHVIARPIPVTDGPSSANNIGAMPHQPQTTPSTLSGAPKEDHEELEGDLSPKVTTKPKEAETTTTSDDVVAVISMTTDEVTTVRSSTEYELKVSTEKISEAAPAETLEEKLSGFFRCTDGTLIDITSLCDKKADCPDYSDEDSCNADEKENLTKQIHRPSLNWNEVAPKGSRDDILIPLDDSRLSAVVEMEQSRTEAPTTFRCEEGGDIIPITAVCDKRADCLDYSDEFNCDGNKHVTEATTTMDTVTKLSSTKPKFESSPTIEVLNEDDEVMEFFQCLDGSAVVPMRAVCDKKWDCLDFSDEDECDSHGKLPITKANKTKPGMAWATPRTPADLPDREQNMIVQEMPDAKGTLPEFWLCENGNYIFISSVCDKKDDCGDFSDEDDCTGNRKIPTTEAPDTVLVTTPSSLSNLAERGTLSMTTIMSTTVQSTPASLTLFHADDVKSWSQGVTPAMNNMEEKYPAAIFQCDDGQEIEAMKVCDHNVDCYDGSDEDDCYGGWFEEPNARLRFAREAQTSEPGSGTGPTPIVCGVGCFQCNDDTCINETLTCNGNVDCSDGEDEDRSTLCIGACDFPTLDDRVVLATGTPSQSLYLNGTVLVLDCILGSVITGDSSITCLDGSFSAGPICSRNCHIDLDRNALTCSSNVYTHGSNPNCDCESGYELELANEDITCSDSLFLPAHPQCKETNECLMTPTPCDSLASCFNMPLGSFTCICDSGYTGDGITCEDIDECPSDCHQNATCINTPGSYTCECNNGFLGDGFTCIEQVYYSYGTAAGDTTFDATPGVANIDGYTVSGPIARMQLLPIGEQLFQYIYITNSGVIAFNNDPSVDLSEFSHPSAFTANSSTMPAVSVFGSEARTSTSSARRAISSDSTVYYHVYESTATDEFTTELLANVSIQVNNAVLLGNTPMSLYEPKWAMVITWVDLRRFGTEEFTTETDTFQAVLTTDGSKTYVVQLYQENSMLWDADQLNAAVTPVIGYRTSTSFFDLQTSESYSRAAMFRPDGLAGNILSVGSSRKGQFVFRLDQNPDDFVNPAEFCQDWYDDATTLSPSTRGVLPCPCTLQQAASDFRFTACTPYVPINQFAFGTSSVDPYPSYLEDSNQCLQQVFPSFDFTGSRCIYNHSDSLVVGYDSMWESSHLQNKLTVSRSPFSSFYQEWIFDDVLPRHYCCSQSSDAYFCNLYEEKRPPRTCNGYVAVSQAWGRGDPHITTLDTFEYIFNGLGEYTLIMIDSIGFKLQGRTEKAFDNSGAEVNTGTVFTAFVVSQGATTVEFDLNAERTDMTILINGTSSIDPADLQTSEYNSSDSMFNLRYNSVTGARYVATFRDSTSGEDVTVNVGISLRMLDFIFQAPEVYKDGSTRGLYGVWDGDINNEVTFPNGTILPNPESISEDDLFNYGQSWRVDSADSLFTYQSPNVWNTFNGISFTPMFLSELNMTADPALRAAAMVDCSGDTSCLFDALATKDVSIGTNTMMIGMSRDQQVIDLENYSPILSNLTEINPDATYPGINANGVFNLIVNQSYTFQATAMDRNPNDVITYSLDGNVPSSAQIDSTSGIFTWTPENVDQVLIGIQASDGSVSRYLQLLIIVCNCENGGSCDFNSMMEGYSLNNDKFSIAQCTCAMGYAGSFCQDDFDSCELDPCYPGVTCIDEPPPSISASCAACPPSLTGTGFQCWDLDECAESVDGCDQLCINSVGSFSCDCNIGYDLQPDLKACQDINECDRATDICDENANCINNNGSYTCECNDGYVIQADNRTCTDVDECTDSAPCDVNADCGNVIGSYTCTCRSGYLGDGRAECKDDNECFNPERNDCSDFASCENKEGYYVCLCLEGYEGSGLNCTDRNECLEGVSQCSLEAACQNVPGSFMCSCDTGYTGDGNTCVDVDECADSSSNNCDVNALCSNSLGSFSCACNAGYEGDGTTCTDVDECMSGPDFCASTATCTNSPGSYICTCFDGFSGDGFACTDIDECVEQIDNCMQNCINLLGSFICSCNPGFVLDADGATCNIAAGMACTPAEDPCTGGGTCMNAAGLITCTCQRGFEPSSATNCQDIDECAAMTDNCDTSVGVCTNTQGGYTCSCARGYMLAADERTCSNINECETGNDCSPDAVCNDLPGTFTCICNAGYSGNGITCANDNECDLSPCVADSVCTDTVGSFVCSCAPGYVGDQVSGCKDMDECIGMPCDVNGNCTNTPGSFTCTCLAGFSGNGFTCQDILECNDPNICVANSVCIEREGSYTCDCIDGYRGDGTEDCVDVDECLGDSTICHLQATCTNTDGSYNCSCNAGYEGNGTSCSNINECERGTIDCDVNSNCTDTDGSYTCYCIDGYFDATGGRAAAGQCADVDECALGVDACDVNSVCMNNNGSYTCVCNAGYMHVTRTTCTDVLECSQTPGPCNSRAFEICIELEGGYECACQSSTYRVRDQCTMATTLFLIAEFLDIQGLVVEYYYDELTSETNRQGLANDTMAVLMASSTFPDVLDVSVQSMRLLEGGMVAEVIFRVDILITNTATENDLAMVFDNGLTGTYNDILDPDNRVYVQAEIDVDTNECANTTICPTMSMCINTVGSFSCKCFEGYTFTDNSNDTCTDLDECSANICSMDSNCTNSIGSFNCVCNMGYTGDGITCTDNDECEMVSTCQSNEDCINVPGSYNCSCASGYSGTSPMCQDIDECVQQTDQCSQNCINNVGSYGCSCKPGYELDADGFTCNDINECVTANDCGSNSMCNNTVGSYICTCNTGYMGAPPGSLCQDIDECVQQTDRCSQNCINNVGSYGCSCNPGFELDADGFTCNVAPGMECNAVLDPCTGGGMCMNATGLINCTCPRGFSKYNDTHCQDIDECTAMTDNCDRSVGTCNNSPGSYNCSCTDGYMLAADQRTCSDINECVTANDCGSNSMCNNTVGSYICTCNTGYMGSPPGSLCQDIDECAGGSNPCTLANEECVNTDGSYQCVCAAGFVRTSGYCLTSSTITGSITINLVNGRIAPYTASLSDPTSEEYMDLEALVCAAFLNVINGWVNASTPYPMSSCEVTSFAAGTYPETIVSYVITVYGEDTEEVANSTSDIMSNGFSGAPLVWTDENGNTVQLISLFFDNASECMLGTSCSGVNEGCTELEPGFECYCANSSRLYEEMCLYSTRLTGSFRYNRINGDQVTYRPELADTGSAEFTNMTTITCDVFMYQINIWVNVDVPYTFIECNITAFRPGSIIVDFIIDIYGTSQMEAMMRAQVASDNGFQGSPSNWTGNVYTIYVEELIYENLCEPSPCENGGACLYDVTSNTTSCSCPPGFGGPVCENKVACEGYTCQNEGVCQVDIIGDPYCECPAQYTGTFCEIPVSCEELDCQNNSTCEVDSNGVASCTCLDGYEGVRCQLESTPGLSTGVIVGIVLGVVGFVLLVIVLCFCCIIVFAARRRRQRKRELLEGAENWGYGGRRYAPAVAVPAQSSAPSRGAVVRNDPAEFASESSDNFYYYQNTRARPLGGAARPSAPPARPMFNLEDDDDDDTIDSRFSGIIRNMWNMHADQRPEASFDPRELPSTSNFMAGGIPRASVQPRNLYPEYHNAGFERPYVADGTESNAYSEETEEFKTYRGKGRDKSRGPMDPYNYF